MVLCHLVVPTDLSPLAERAFRVAAGLSEQYGATLTAVRVVPTPGAPLTGRVVRVDETDARCGALVEVAASDVAAALLAHTDRIAADLVVMSTHARRGFDRLRRGSIAEAVAREARCPVLLVPRGSETEGWAPGRVLAAVAPDDLATGPVDDPVPATVAWAAALAADADARLDLLTALPTGGYEPLRETAAGLLALSLELSEQGEAPSYGLRHGMPAEAVVAEARRSGADLIVVGSRSSLSLPRRVLGSVAEAVVRRAPCPVLVVPPGAPPPPAPVGRTQRRTLAA